MKESTALNVARGNAWPFARTAYASRIVLRIMQDPLDMGIYDATMQAGQENQLGAMRDWSEAALINKTALNEVGVCGVSHEFMPGMGLHQREALLTMTHSQ